MSLWAVVPVKPLEQAKSRLTDALTPEVRAELVHGLLQRTLAVLRQVPAVTEIVVVTGDPGLQAALSGGPDRVLRTHGGPDLNRELAFATREAQGQHAHAVLVLHADLPLVEATDIGAMLALAEATPCVVIAPDRSGHGTNALLCSPAGLIEYQFGPESFARHSAQAQAVGARLQVCSTPGLALDLDTPEDLRLWRAQRPGSWQAVLEARQEPDAPSADPNEQGGTQSRWKPTATPTS